MPGFCYYLLPGKISKQLLWMEIEYAKHSIRQNRHHNQRRVAGSKLKTSTALPDAADRNLARGCYPSMDSRMVRATY